MKPFHSRRGWDVFWFALSAGPLIGFALVLALGFADGFAEFLILGRREGLPPLHVSSLLGLLFGAAAAYLIGVVPALIVGSWCAFQTNRNGSFSYFDVIVGVAIMVGVAHLGMPHTRSILEFVAPISLAVGWLSRRLFFDD